MDEAKALATAKRAAMVAPAGYGKTHTIARAVAEYGSGRDLILTHTHAGVDALRTKLRMLGASSRAFRVDTIAGWTLGLARAFPKSSGLEITTPRFSDEYRAVYAAATRLLALRPMREVIQASYGSVYIDEYQDCSLDQHDVVLALADLLPCRVVGDPMQGIFDFASCRTVDWVADVEKEFTSVTGPSQPWRWSTTNPELGEWLADVRIRLANDPPLAVDLANSPAELHISTDARSARACQVSCCHQAADCDGETSVAIHAWEKQCHDVARQLRGRFRCVEPIDSRTLYDSAGRIDEAMGFARAVEVLDFAGRCMTKVQTELKTMRKAFADGRVPSVRKHPDQLQCLLRVAEDQSLRPVEEALRILPQVEGCIVYRYELLSAMRRAVDAVVGGEATSLLDAAWIVRNRSRRRGRILPRCAIGTTLLVKGLEFDHSVVLNATALKARNLYVALTRGSQSLTAICRSPVLTPQPGC